MKTWMLVIGILLLGGLLGYLLFLLGFSNSNSFVGSTTNPYTNSSAFQSTRLPSSSPGTAITSPFKTQSFTDKTIVVE